MHDSTLAKIVPFLTFCLLVATFLVSPVSSPNAHARDFSGSWANDLYLNPQSPSSIVKYRSTLSVSYSTGGVDYSSETVFHEDELYSQVFDANTRIGIFDLSSTASFDPAEVRLDYWLTEGGFTLAGARMESNFLLEYSEPQDAFGAGLELGVSGNLTDTVSLEAISRFGMDENEPEALGLIPGSGYDIITSHGVQTGAYGPSQLQYVNTEIQLSGMVFDCCEYDVTTEISEANGFEETEFEFDIGGENNPIGFEVDLTFAPQTKSIEIDPSFVTNWGCFDVYTTLTTTAPDNELHNNGTKASEIDGFQVKGFALRDVSLGHVSFSSITSLDGNLYRAPRTYHMDLHADDYIIEPPQDYAALYRQTAYDQIFSLYKSGEDLKLTFGGDFYFDMSSDSSGTSSLFDLALVTGNGSYELSDQFTMGAGFAVEPNKVDSLRLSFDYSF